MSRLEELKREVWEANLELVRAGLVVQTFGNASGILRESDLVAIKPSGVPYDRLTPEEMVVTDLRGTLVEGQLRPSSDLQTHLVLYGSFQGIGGVVHTHSRFAAAWAQAGLEIPCLGTTHADYFRGPVPVCDRLRPEEIRLDYELNTGYVIARRFRDSDPMATPAVLVPGHGPFCWGTSVSDAVHTAVILEEVARLAYYTLSLNRSAEALSSELVDKHFLRKHGPKAYYGQD